VLVLQLQLPVVDEFSMDVPEAVIGHFLSWDVRERRRLKCLLWRAPFIVLSLCTGAQTFSNEGKKRECKDDNQRYGANAYSNDSRFGNVMALGINDGGVRRYCNYVSLKPVLISTLSDREKRNPLGRNSLLGIWIRFN